MSRDLQFEYDCQSFVGLDRVTRNIFREDPYSVANVTFPAETAMCTQFRTSGIDRSDLGPGVFGPSANHSVWDCLFSAVGQQCRHFRRGIQREGLRRMDSSRIAIAG
jgi:hypothetical protein